VAGSPVLATPTGGPRADDRARTERLAHRGHRGVTHRRCDRAPSGRPRRGCAGVATSDELQATLDRFVRNEEAREGVPRGGHARRDADRGAGLDRGVAVTGPGRRRPRRDHGIDPAPDRPRLATTATRSCTCPPGAVLAPAFLEGVRLGSGRVPGRGLRDDLGQRRGALAGATARQRRAAGRGARTAAALCSWCGADTPTGPRPASARTSSAAAAPGSSRASCAPSGKYGCGRSAGVDRRSRHARLGGHEKRAARRSMRL